MADDLKRMQISYLLPLRKEIRYYGKRRALVEVPLFPGYIFLCGDLEQVYAADRTRRVANVLEVKDQARIRWELENLTRTLAVNSSTPLDPYPYLKVGVRVEVRSGPFRGIQGMVADRRCADRLLLQVELLGQAVSLELHGALLEPID